MAVISTPFSLPSLNKSASTIIKNTYASTKSINNISKAVFSRTKVKREAFANIKTEKNRREEDENRKQREDELEAPNIVTNPGGPQQLAQTNTSRGFFSRILGFLGYLTAGWIMNNLPTWIGMGKEFIARLKKAEEIASGFFNNTIKLFTGFGNLLGSIGQNILNFDFFDTSNRVKNSIAELNSTVAGLGNQLEEALGLITTPLTQGKYSGEKIPELGSEAQDQGAYPPPEPYTGPTSSGGVLNPQEGYAYLRQLGVSHVHALGILANIKGESDFRIGVSEKGGGGGIGLFQYTSEPRKSNFLKAVPDYKTNWKGQIKFAIGEDRGPEYLKMQFSSPEEAAYWWMNKWERPAARVYSGRNAKHNDFIRSFKPSSTRQTSVASGQPSSSSSVQIQSQPTLVTSGFGWRWGRQHQGIDLAVKNGKTEGTPLIIKKSGIVDYAFIGRGNMGQVMITHEDGTQSRYLHVNNFKVSSGQKIGPGQIIAYLAGMGQPGIGNATGPHLHFEYYPSKSSGPVNPASVYNNYVSLGGKVFGNTGNPLDSGYTPRASSPSQRAPAQITATPSSTQQRAAIPSAITPDRTPQDIMVYQPPSQQNIITSSGGGGGTPSSAPINEAAMLNNFIKNKLLLDLAYL